MRGDDLAVGVGRLVEAARLGVRAFAPVDTNRVPGDWEHVTKVDPEAAKRLPLLYPLYLRHTGAISVGGSRDVTAQNTAETFELLEGLPVAAFHEPSGPRHVTSRTRELAAFMAVPEVLNGDTESLIGKLGAGAEYVRDELAPELIDRKAPWLPDGARARAADFATSWMLASAVFEAYIIQNPDSAAAREANVTADDLLSPEEAAQRAMAAERHLESDVIYVEYSGTFGGEEAVAILEAVSDAVSWSRVWYGGGLDSRETAEAVLDAGADAVIVGDVFHDVAAEEADLCAEAAEALAPDADRTEVRAWVTDAIDLADASATRYLSTIPGVDDSRGTARAYLTATVRASLELEAFAAGVDGDATPERAVAGRDPAALPGAGQLGRVLGVEDAVTLARSYALARLGGEPDLPVGHVSLPGEREPVL